MKSDCYAKVCPSGTTEVEDQNTPAEQPMLFRELSAGYSFFDESRVRATAREIPSSTAIMGMRTNNAILA